MNVIKVKFNIDIDNEQQVNSFNNFVNELKTAGGAQATVQSPVKDIKAPVPAQVPAATTAPVATQTVTPAPSNTATATTPPEGVSKKLFEIRKVIGEKATNVDHRTAMVAKLAEYGVETATDLPVDKYEDFHTFLLGLV